jgi:predicted glycogen debranching enzyme
MIKFSTFDLTPSNKKEWLITNGNGGYASSTTIGMNTRKYHGLLVSSSQKVLLSKFEEKISNGKDEFYLSTNQYPGKIYPEGYKNLIEFEFENYPKFLFLAGNSKIEKKIKMIKGKDTTLISYRLVEGESADIFVRPLLFPRKTHQDPTTEDKKIEFEVYQDSLHFFGQEPFTIKASDGRFVTSQENYRNVIYEEEQKRGYPYCETLFSPGVFEAHLSEGKSFHLVVSKEKLTPSEALNILDRQELQKKHLLRLYEEKNFTPTDFASALILAADSFVCKSKNRYFIKAGYHWFSEWGRDTMISIPGLLLCTGKEAIAREILLDWSKKLKDGLLPNFISEDGEVNYNSSDASLWYINAVFEYLSYTNDYSFVFKYLWRSMKNIFSEYVQGNEIVRMDGDCLLKVRSASTWMDAQINGSQVTPRNGKPIEINALWYSDLCIIFHLASIAKENKTKELVSTTIEEVKNSFSKFLSTDGHLFDVIEPNDLAFRPNQVFAISLPYSPLNQVQKKYLFNIIRSKIYTPIGLYSLAPNERKYHDTYCGNQIERDLAYHQGMIWPWLLGPFYQAQLNVYPDSAKQIISSLRPLWEIMKKENIGTLPEIFEPKTGKPAGAFSQAWSIAEVLRIYTKVKKKLENIPSIEKIYQMQFNKI